MKKFTIASLFLMLAIPTFSFADTFTYLCDADTYDKEHHFTVKFLVKIRYSFLTQQQKVAMLGLTAFIASNY
jgi:hypothetical protein